MQQINHAMSEEQKMNIAMRSKVWEELKKLNDCTSITVDGKEFALSKIVGTVYDEETFNVSNVFSLEEEYTYLFVAYLRFWQSIDGSSTTILVKIDSLCELYWKDKQWYATIKSLTFSKL